jgi:voltage-gated potassium channel
VRPKGPAKPALPPLRIAKALLALLAVTVMGTLGYFVIGRGAWPIEDCVYMTVMTLTTVGFGEVLPGFAETPYARTFSSGLMIVGVSVVAYAASLLAAVVFEGELALALGLRRMTKVLSKLSDHYIVCGAGSMGIHIVEELASRGEPFVMIEQDPERLDKLAEAYPDVPWIKGDATEDELLTQAGIERARGLFAALSLDKDNLFVVISARQSNPRARIVARAIEGKSVRKLRTAGADATVSPNYLGGRRMASEMMRPQVVAFMDVVSKDRDREFDIEEVAIGSTSPFAGKTLAEAKIRQLADALVLAVADPDSDAYRYNPPSDAVLPPGGKIMVLASADSVERLRAALS